MASCGNHGLWKMKGSLISSAFGARRLHIVGYPSLMKQSANFLANLSLSLNILPKETQRNFFFPRFFHPQIHYISSGVSQEQERFGMSPTRVILGGMILGSSKPIKLWKIYLAWLRAASRTLSNVSKKSCFGIGLQTQCPSIMATRLRDIKLKMF